MPKFQNLLSSIRGLGSERLRLLGVVTGGHVAIQPAKGLASGAQLKARATALPSVVQAGSRILMKPANRKTKEI